MFVIVDFSDNRKRRFEKFRKHIIKTKRCDLMGSAPFFVAECHRDYFDPAELEGIIKQCGTALFKDGFIPRGFEKYQFVPSVLPLRMLVRSAASFFRDLPSAKRNISVCVIDEYAYAVEETAALSQYVRFVKVVSKRADLYSSAVEKAYNSFGAVIAVSSDGSLAENSDLVISLNDEKFNMSNIKCGIVYSKKTYSDSIFNVHESSFLLPGFKNETQGIDDFLFLCAVFETCGYKLSEIPIFCDIKSILFETFT